MARFNLTNDEFNNLDQSLMRFSCDGSCCFFTISIKYKINNQYKIFQSKLIRYKFSEPQNISELRNVIQNSMNFLEIDEEGREFDSFDVDNCQGLIGSGKSTSDIEGSSLQKMYIIGYYKDNKNLYIIISKLNRAKIKEILGSLQIKCT